MAYPTIKSGEYKHFKNKLYTVFSTAIDLDNNVYVLYRQKYGDNLFWIRPYENFIENTPDGSKRFSFTSKLRRSELYKDLNSILKTNPFTLKHSETNEQFLIYSVPENESEPIKICPIKVNDNA